MAQSPALTVGQAQQAEWELCSPSEISRYNANREGSKPCEEFTLLLSGVRLSGIILGVCQCSAPERVDTRARQAANKFLPPQPLEASPLLPETASTFS